MATRKMTFTLPVDLVDEFVKGLRPGSAQAFWRKLLRKNSTSEISSLSVPVKLPTVTPSFKPLKGNSVPSAQNSVSRKEENDGGPRTS